MPPVIGIRREDKNEWERRVPFAPRHVRALVGQGIAVRIQPSAVRVFGDEEYAEAGAQVQEDLSGCAVVFGIKEFPLSFFHPGQACAFFSHTIKGQAHNMAMLQRLLDLGCSLIDYEKVTDEHNRRLLYFGNYAGLAGMLETLYTYGRRLEWEGIQTPLLALKRPLEYASLGEARTALEVVGQWIAAGGLPPAVCPLVVGFAGYGNVSQGAQGILDILPVTEIQPAELAAFMAAGQHSRFRVYKVVFHEQDMVAPIDPDHEFELQDYYRHPEKYRGVFAGYLEHLSILLNGIYWDARYPRLVKREWLRNYWTPGSRLKVLGDVTCDIGGSIECNLAAADPGQPVYVYLPDQGTIVQGWQGPGPVVMAVDNLPSELPRESSTYFGDKLLPLVPGIARADLSAPFDELSLSPEIMRALIAHRGTLTPDYAYISDHLHATTDSGESRQPPESGPGWEGATARTAVGHTHQ